LQNYTTKNKLSIKILVSSVLAFRS